MVGLSGGEKCLRILCLPVFVQYTNMTDRRTPHRPHYAQRRAAKWNRSKHIFLKDFVLVTLGLQLCTCTSSYQTFYTNLQTGRQTAVLDRLVRPLSNATRWRPKHSVCLLLATLQWCLATELRRLVEQQLCRIYKVNGYDLTGLEWEAFMRHVIKLSRLRLTLALFSSERFHCRFIELQKIACLSGLGILLRPVFAVGL